jgi:hypothetical protein
MHHNVACADADAHKHDHEFSDSLNVSVPAPHCQTAPPPPRSLPRVAKALFRGVGGGGVGPVVDIYQELIATKPCPVNIVVLLKQVQTAAIIITHDSLRLGRGDN